MQVSIKTFVYCHSLQLGGVIISKQCLHGQIQADNTNVETIELKPAVF